MHLTINKDIEAKLANGVKKFQQQETEKIQNQESLKKLESKMKDMERSHHAILIEREGLYNKLNDQYVESKRLNNVLENKIESLSINFEEVSKRLQQK